MILAVFAVAVAELTQRQVKEHFVAESEVSFASMQVTAAYYPASKTYYCTGVLDYDAADLSQARVYNASGQVVCTQQEELTPTAQQLAKLPAFSVPDQPANYYEGGYFVQTRRLPLTPHGSGWLLYARPLSTIDSTVDSVRVFLTIGVLGGTLLALLAGLYVAQRAMRPIKELTDAAREIERTRDPRLRIPLPEAEDEIAELARTLEGMLAALDAARSESESALERQREFVADASHELRTPLTSVLANLELLADELDGEQADSANAALRATRRMRRLVGDLLLLARADVERRQPHRLVDLADVLTDAAAELGPLGEARELTVSPEPVVIDGIQDDLHRMILNLIENAVHHTPAGTRIKAATKVRDGVPELIVEDNGPGIPPDLRQRVFERFFRGGGDTGGGPRGTGLGLAIVKAVAEAHDATVTLESVPEFHGTRFQVTFEPARSRTSHEPALPEPAEVGQTSTTTGSTIGRRRSRS